MGTLTSLQVGDEVKEAFRVAGRKGQVVGRSSGGTITYGLSSMQGGTLFQREFIYQMPNLFLTLLDKLVFSRRIRAESEQALGRLKHNLEQPGLPAVEASEQVEVEG